MADAGVAGAAEMVLFGVFDNDGGEGTCVLVDEMKWSFALLVREEVRTRLIPRLALIGARGDEMVFDEGLLA